MLIRSTAVNSWNFSQPNTIRAESGQGKADSPAFRRYPKAVLQLAVYRQAGFALNVDLHGAEQELETQYDGQYR